MKNFSPTQTDTSAVFRALCNQRSLVLPNVWDAASAVCAARAGAPAIATTSAGVAWAHGVHDGGGLKRGQALQALADITPVTDLPVTADIEYGYEAEDLRLADFVKEVLTLGVVGVNIEDSYNGSLVDAAHQAQRITVVRAAAESVGVDLFINARVDTAFFGPSDAEQRDAECLSRAALYIDAGADGIFVPGITDLPTVTSLADALSVPLNIMVGPGSPSVRALLDAGVGRITTGMAGALAAYAQIESAAQELLRHGTYGVSRSDKWRGLRSA